MNRYIIPVYSLDADETWIETVSANSLEDAKDILMNRFYEEYELENCFDYATFIDICSEHDIVLGRFYDLDELEC